MIGARLLAALGVLLGHALPGCYDVPQPQCGFRCGPNGACPEGYTCKSSDGRCHLNGSPVSLVCGTVDAGVDGPRDAGTDATDAM
jgi:hypothetical protein